MHSLRHGPQENPRQRTLTCMLLVLSVLNQITYSNAQGFVQQAESYGSHSYNDSYMAAYYGYDDRSETVEDHHENF